MNRLWECLFFCVGVWGAQAATLGNLRCEYLINPQGIGKRAPRLSWIMRADVGARGVSQESYQVLVASAPEKLARGEADLWDSGRVRSARSIQIVYQGRPLAAHDRCYWKVRAWDNAERETPWSAPASWTVGLLRASDWQAEWLRVEEVTPAQTASGKASCVRRIQTPRYLRRAFDVADAPVRATLYATALGLYEMRLNGRRVGDALLTPQWTAYDKRVQVQAYDVTTLVKPGANALGALLGNGWYCGTVQCWPPEICLYGNEPRLKAQLEIEFANGGRQTVATDAAWLGSVDGPLRFSGIYEGETYDARKEMDGWDAPGFKADGRWHPALIDRAVAEKTGELTWQRGEPIRVTQELTPVAVSEPKSGVYVFDFGQNMVGWARLKVRGEAGQTVEIFFNEMLNPDGTVYRENLHAGKMGKAESQTDRYTLRGGGGETFEPHFTYHGFRYAEVRGLKGKPDASMLTGCVFHTSFAQTGRFACSDPLLTRLAQNIQWSQRGNMMCIPTDCPQRDERAGWTGDAQFFMPTAVYNYDVAGFFSKWLYDLCEDSFVESKGFADMAPYYGKLGAGNTGWGDAGVVCPYVLYRTYGDTRVIEAHYAQMRRHVMTLTAACKNHIRGAGAYGDWLNVGGGAKGEVCGTAYQVYLCDLMSEMAQAIGKGDDAAMFASMAGDARTAFQKTFFREDGSIVDSSLTGYALAFTMGLVPDALREKAAAKFKGEVVRFKECVATGFIGTPRLLTGLHEAGLDAEAYRMLLRREYPSWLYPVTLGATTIWERWDGWRPDKGFQDPNMNSFNHYAFGSCGQYLFKCVGGIYPLEPGYRKFAVAPVIGEGLTWANTSYTSIYGDIVSNWKKENGKIRLDVTVPPNTCAVIRLPATSPDGVMESGHALAKSEGLSMPDVSGGAVCVHAASGCYAFVF